MSQFLKSTPNQPIIFSICIILGLLLGKQLFENKTYESGFSQSEIKQGKILDILQKINDYYVDTINIVEIQENTINNLLQELDPHSSYVASRNVSEENERMKGNFTGIGVHFRIIEDTVRVISTVKNGPSEKIKIKAGDKIISINNHSFVGDSITGDLVQLRLKGLKGSVVKVGVLRNKNTLSFNVHRGEVALKSVDFSSFLAPGVGYIKINRFARKTINEFKEEVNELHKVGLSQLVIDLRDNGGGLLQAVVDICKELLPAGSGILSTKGRFENDEISTLTNGKLASLPLIILINENSASASEILAGAIQDNDRGVIMGRRSFGKGLVQRPFILKDGSSLKLTIARYLTPSGRCIQKEYKEDNEQYRGEFYARLNKGELYSKDSIHITDSTKYYTKKERIVFGGSGIIPDVFIPVDTSFYTDEYLQIARTNTLTKFYLNQIGSWEDTLTGNTIKEAYKRLENSQLWNAFTTYYMASDTSNVGPSLVNSREIILQSIYSRILNVPFGNEGYNYPTLQTDPYIQKILATPNLHQSVFGQN